MIRDVNDLEDGAVLRADVGVVGAGFAGIDLAVQLGRLGMRVVLLESGREEFDARTQELVRLDSIGKPIREADPDGPFTPYLPPQFRGETRVRQFGGTSNVWTGKWRTFDQIDLERRPWVAHSGWPIDLETLEPFYAEVGTDYGPEDIAAFQPERDFAHLADLVAGSGLEVSGHMWQAEALRMAARFGAELRRAPGIDVVLGANAVEILLAGPGVDGPGAAGPGADGPAAETRPAPGAEEDRPVLAIAFRSLDGRSFQLEAEHFVLSTGGLEAPRLLLASNRQVAGGVGNAHDLVGRFFQDHPKHKRGVLRHSAALRDSQASLTATQPRPRPQVSFALSEEIQRREKLLNHAVYLQPRYRYDVEHPTEQVTALRDAAADRSLPRLLTSSAALARSPRAVRSIAERRRHRGRGGPLSHYGATLYVEQAPNPDSRVLLGAERDALGVPKLVVDWRFTELDHASFERTHVALREAFTRAGLGELDFGAGTLGLEDTVDAAHHIGATRMGATPSEGVVDPDLRVFGTTNLFIATSSVFPTGHSAAPTYTILALARRLRAHLLGLRSR